MQASMNLRFWRYLARRRERKRNDYISMQTAAATQVFQQLRNFPPTVNHVIRHEKRPPAPRPQRLTVVYQMQDGQEIKTYIPIHGQRSWTESFPHWLQNPHQSNWPPVCIRYEFGYEDGGT
jgi:hypothetical protein